MTLVVSTAWLRPLYCDYFTVFKEQIAVSPLLYGYKLTFDDEFNTLNAGLPGTPGITWETEPFYLDTSNGGEGTINPTPPGQPGSLLSVHNGVLDMAITDTYDPYLETNPNGVPGGFSQQYGYFEMRAELPTTSGFYSAFWMLPDNGSTWPPEIDIMEHPADYPNLLMMTNQGGTSAADNAAGTGFYQSLDWNAPDLSAAFHTYGFAWTPTTMTWYLDGQEMFSAPVTAAEQEPFHLILSAYSNHGRGWLPDVKPGATDQMLVDWVHVYSNDPNAVAIAGQPGYQNHDGSTSSETSPPPAPTPVSSGSGSDALVLSISEDAYANGDGTSDANGDATFTVSVDGKQLAGTFTAQALHSAGQDQTFTFKGDWAPGTHTITVNFLDDAYGGTATTDRNLYVDGVTYDGTNTGQSAALLSSGPQSFSITDTTPVAPLAPAPVVTGSGSDALVLSISEDAYANGDGTSDANGDATFTVSVDGKQLAGTFTAQALHSAGQDQTFTFKGDWAPGTHTITVNFLDDAYGGTATTDRNLYVDGVTYDGTNTGQSAALLSSGPQSFSITDTTPVAPLAPAPVVTGSGSDALVLSISEDAYANGDGTSDANGDAAFTVSVDGKQQAGTFYATASHSAGAGQTFTFKGNWAPGAHTVTVAFLNDAYAGTPSTDRNLYVNDVTYDGTDTKQSAALMSTGSQTFSVTDSTAIPPVVTGGGSDSLVVKVSEDYYLANAQFTVSIDGKQLGSTFTATTLHSSGNNQTFAFAGDFGSGQHTVSVNFLNDAWAGTPATDRNLYVTDIVYNGTDTGQTAALMSAGAKTFSVLGGTTPSVSETGDHGSLQKNLSQTGSYTVGGDTFVLGSGNAATVTLGAGASQIKFVGPSSVTLTGGAGQATFTADAGNNKFVAGAGSLDVTGGAGKDAYVFHTTSGLLTLEDFSLAKGDTLTIDRTLQGSLHEASDGVGGTMLSFGTTGHGVDIHGLAALPGSNVLWA